MRPNAGAAPQVHKNRCVKYARRVEGDGRDYVPGNHDHPIRGTEDESFRYRLRVNGNPPHMWTTPRIYIKPDEVVASFSPPLRADYQAAILDMLRDGKEVTFSLKDAYTSV